MGIYLSDHDHDCLTNLRYTDDVLLFATSQEQLQHMLCDFKESTEKVGLRIHPEKTKVLGNQSSLSPDSKKEMQIGDVKIEILTRSESVRHLGQLITFQQQETTEIKNRIRAAWATFHKYRQELTSKNYLLKHRLRLLDAAITPTIIYASGTWAPTKEHERMLQSAQRKMFRLIINKLLPFFPRFRIPLKNSLFVFSFVAIFQFVSFFHPPFPSPTICKFKH